MDASLAAPFPSALQERESLTLKIKILLNILVWAHELLNQESLLQTEIMLKLPIAFKGPEHFFKACKSGYTPAWGKLLTLKEIIKVDDI